MKKIFEDLKNTLKNTFHLKDKSAEESKSNETSANRENLKKGSIQPGLDEKEEDVGKKVFERTGHLHEGVGQSSTPEPQEAPTKTTHGIKNHEPHKKRYSDGRRPKAKK